MRSHDRERTNGRRAVVVLVIVLAVLSACSAHPKPGGTATLRSDPPTTDPWAVPAVIDLPYIQRVMDRLDQSMGEAIREMVATKSVDPKVDSILSSVYHEDELTRTQTDFHGALGQLSKYRATPGNPQTRVNQILSASGKCVFVATSRTFAPAFITRPEGVPSTTFVGLRPDATMTAPEWNPTRWLIVLDGRTVGAGSPPDPCK